MTAQQPGIIAACSASEAISLCVREIDEKSKMATVRFHSERSLCWTSAVEHHLVTSQ